MVLYRICVCTLLENAEFFRFVNEFSMDKMMNIVCLQNKLYTKDYKLTRFAPEQPSPPMMRYDCITIMVFAKNN